MQKIGLVLDTCTERGVFAAFDGKACLFEEQLPFGIQNSDLLLPLLQKKIQERQINLRELSFLGVGVGPGSYTGIRVGATIAKILAFVLNIPLVGVCTLEAFLPEKEGVFASVIDAKLGGVYLQIGHLKNGEVELLVPAASFPLPEAAKQLASISTIVTPNAEKIRPKLHLLLPQNTWEWQERYSSVEQLYRIAQKKQKLGKSCSNQNLELLYMRKTQAEIEKENKNL